MTLPASDPTARLAELDADKPGPGNPWRRSAWWTERAAVLDTLGRRDEALAALDRAWRADPGVESNVRFARRAAEDGKRLGVAEFAAGIAVDRYRDYADDAAGRALYAEALALRGWLRLRLGRWQGADRDAHDAIAVADSAAGHVIAGLTAHHWRYEADAAKELARGLAHEGNVEPGLATAGRAALASLWSKAGWWVADGYEGWIDLHKTSETPARGGLIAAADRLPFPDLVVQVGGARRPISSFAGPMVVDVWATWCGPCREGLAEFDAAARAHPGVPFVAISVDKEESVALAALAGEAPSFVQAWAGEGALKSLAAKGIPVTFILDAQHRVAASHRGFSPGRMEQFVLGLGAVE